MCTNIPSENFVKLVKRDEPGSLDLESDLESGGEREICHAQGGRAQHDFSLAWLEAA